MGKGVVISRYDSSTIKGFRENLMNLWSEDRKKAVIPILLAAYMRESDDTKGLVADVDLEHSCNSEITPIE